MIVHFNLKLKGFVIHWVEVFFVVKWQPFVHSKKAHFITYSATKDGVYN